MLHAPTIPEEDALFVPQKHNFAETFDCSPFVGCQKIPCRHRNGHQMHDPHTNQPMWNEEVNINGGPRADWLKAIHLNGNSSPADWFQAFLPVFDGSCRRPWVSNTPFWTHKWANFLNVKAASMGAGVQGGMYSDFKPFSYEDIEKHLALYILQGLNLSPQVEQKFASQKPVHFLSTICETIKWVQCTKHVYCVETEQVEEVKFLHLNINDDYNHDMSNVNIADQLQNYYRFDHWMRKQKWWGSLFFWAFGVLLVNAYVCYCHHTISIGKCPMSHYDFRKSMLLHGWIPNFIGKIGW